jgi:hypothetical protein
MKQEFALNNPCHGLEQVVSASGHPECSDEGTSHTSNFMCAPVHMNGPMQAS